MLWELLVAVVFVVLVSQPVRVKAKVCHSVDIRNKPERLEDLRGCTVVEGYVRIVLMERGNGTDFDKHSLPELREITEYLMFFRVVGLRKIGQIFPNLTVIRGGTLFRDYALVVYEMFNLQEVALWSLTHIMRGAVRIEKNPSLCYVHTVDWELIAPWDPDKNYVSHNKSPSDCPGCDHSCDQELCWSHDHCQMQRETVVGCDPMCIGGCSEPGPRGCHTCSKYFTADNQCVHHCPQGTLQFLDRRCVTKDECISTKLPIESQSQLSSKRRVAMYVTFNNTCTDHCPAGYKIDAESRSCVVCQGVCPKSCPGSNVESISDAQALRGCTHIEGSLGISIKIGKPKIVHQELEENLGAIEEIEGCLKITRSTPIVNLHFFKNLTTIHGVNVNENYAFIVMNNPNLQELWDWDIKSSFKILNKRLFFHYNPKLCLHHISRLIEIVQQRNVTNLEVAQESNGDKFPCNATEIKLEVVSKSFNFIQIRIPQVVKESWYFLRYQVHFIKNENDSVSLYDDVDLCSDFGWRTRDVYTNISNENIPREGVLVNLTRLEPYVQYAYYVSVYSVDSIVATSVLYYERTLPHKPTELTSVEAYSNSSSQIVVSWEPPRQTNGKLENFVLKWTELSNDESLRNNRDYCEHPMVHTPDAYIANQKTFRKLDNSSCCTDHDYSSLPVGFEEVEPGRTFEVFFSKNIFLSDFRENKDNMKEDSINCTAKITAQYDSNHFQTNISSTGKSKENIKYLPASARSFTIMNVKHFCDYVVEVKACREQDSRDNKQVDDYNCSKTEIIIVRTMKDESSDSIPNSIHHRVVNKTLLLSWDEPRNPNGFVLAFQFEYKNMDISNPKTSSHCISYQEFVLNEHEHAVPGLLPGNYEFRIQAITLAGKGPFSKFTQFTISNGFVLSNISVMFLLIMFILLVAVSRTLLVNYVKRKKCKLNSILIASVNPHYQTTLDKWELCRNNILIGKELGSGTFGKVYEGILLPNSLPCAVKTVSEDSFMLQRNIFLNEASILKSVCEAHHIVQLLGVVSTEKPPLVVMELMNQGDLRGYLRSIRDIDEPHDPFKLKAAAEIADGMCFLEAKKYVHRDLAARNCLVSDNLTVKVADFGMTRDIYETDYYRKGSEELLPIRWMAPESLHDGLFTSQSDVWSYGVVLWEIVTLGEQPYQGLSNEEVLKNVIADKAHLVIPNHCDKILRSLMMSCWRRKSNLRINFMNAVKMLESCTDEDFKNTSYYHSKEAENIRSASLDYVEMGSVEDPLLCGDNSQRINSRSHISFLRTFTQRKLFKLSAISEDESSQENI